MYCRANEQLLYPPVHMTAIHSAQSQEPVEAAPTVKIARAYDHCHLHLLLPLIIADSTPARKIACLAQASNRLHI